MKKVGKGIWEVVKNAGVNFVEDEAVTYAGAVAFFTALSFAPMLVILLTVGGAMGDEAQQQLVTEVRELIGPTAGEAVDVVISGADNAISLTTFAGIVGGVTLLFAATAVLAQLQNALNRVWNIKAKPAGGIGIRDWLRKRLLSLAMLVVIGFLLLMSLAISAALSLLFGGEGFIWRAVNFAVSLVVFTLLFAMMFKVLPDVQIAWRDVWVGAGLTALLFAVGKTLIGLYLGNSSVGSAYGAAGSVVVFLFWVYYSCIILLFGAELTQSYALRYGARFEPDRHAEWGHNKPQAAG